MYSSRVCLKICMDFMLQRRHQITMYAKQCNTILWKHVVFIFCKLNSRSQLRFGLHRSFLLILTTLTRLNFYTRQMLLVRQLGLINNCAEYSKINKWFSCQIWFLSASAFCWLQAYSLSSPNHIFLGAVEWQDTGWYLVGDIKGQIYS